MPQSQLFFNQSVGTALGHILWVGGDGSAKLYRKQDATTWIAAASGALYTPSVTYPDAGWSFVHGPGTDDPLIGYHRQLGGEGFFTS